MCTYGHQGGPLGPLGPLGARCVSVDKSKLRASLALQSLSLRLLLAVEAGGSLALLHSSIDGVCYTMAMSTAKDPVPNTQAAAFPQHPGEDTLAHAAQIYWEQVEARLA